MEKQRKTLIFASAFFFACVAMDIISFIIAMVNGSLKFDASVTGLSEASANTAVTVTFIILLAIASIGTIIKLYLAVKGIRLAYGKGGKGEGYIKWAKIVAVLLIIGVIGTVSNITKGTDQWYALISPVISLVATYFYIRSASALKA